MDVVLLFPRCFGERSTGSVTPPRILNLEVTVSQSLKYRTAGSCLGRPQVGLRGSTQGEQGAGAKQEQRPGSLVRCQAHEMALNKNAWVM